MNTAPPAAALRWATEALGRDRAVESVSSLRDDRAGPWLLRLAAPRHDGGAAPAAPYEARGGPAGPDVVLKIGRNTDRAEMAGQVAGLRFANEHDLPAPALLAYDLDSDTAGGAGGPALLVSAIAGSSVIPREAGPERLRTMGAVAATLSRVVAGDESRLPLRTRPIPLDDHMAARRRTGDGTPLLRRADDLADALGIDRPPPAAESVFVHGDFWQGNMLWSGDRFVGLVDWDCAGHGREGIDLGSARLDAALMFGCAAAGFVLRGWEETMGRPARDVAWADLVAAVNHPADLADFLPAIHGQGRGDLTANLLNARREEFLTAAVERLGG